MGRRFPWGGCSAPACSRPPRSTRSRRSSSRRGAWTRSSTPGSTTAYSSQPLSSVWPEVSSCAAERLPWLLLGTALALWTTGDLYYYFFLSGAAEVPIPSVADPFYLAFYPVSYVALALLAPQAHARLPRAPLARRRDRLAGRGRPRSGGRLRQGPEHDRRERARGRDEPRLPARRPAPALARRRDVRAHRLALRRNLGARGARVRGVCDCRQHLPLRDGRRDVRRRRAARRRLACGARPHRLLRLAADPQARRRTRRELGGIDGSNGVRRSWARGAGVRPLHPDQHRGRRALGSDDRRGDRPRGAHVPRARGPARDEPRGGAHRSADRAREPEAIRGRPRARARRVRPDRARGLRPGRLQGVQRLVRPRCGRHAAEPGRRPLGRCDGRLRNRVPPRRRRVLRSRLDRARRLRKRDRTSRRSADRGGRGLRGQLLLRRSADARGGLRADGRFAHGRRPHVPPQAAEPPERGPAGRRRSAERARRARFAAHTTSRTWPTWPRRSAAG